MDRLSLDVAAVHRNSRRAAVITVVGGAVALAALGGSAWQVAALQQRRSVLAAENQELAREQVKLGRRIAELRTVLRSEEERRELAGAQLAQGNTAVAATILDAPAQTSAAASAAERRRVSVPRVYFQLRSAAQVPNYRACNGALTAAGYRIPDYELVEGGPRRNEIRYFHAGETETATRLADALTRCLGDPVRLVYVGRYPSVNPLHFEVWLAPPAQAREGAGAAAGQAGPILLPPPRLGLTGITSWPPLHTAGA